MTYKPSANFSYLQWTSSTGASPARTLVLQALVQAWKAAEADFISKSKDWCEKLPRRLSSLKTFTQLGPGEEREWSKDFPASGMTVGGRLFPLPELGAPHLRERWFLLAYRPGFGRSEGRPWAEVFSGRNDSTGRCETLADTDFQRLEVGQQGDSGELSPAFGGSWWELEPSVGRVAHGVPQRVDRIECLGNAVVPKQARTAFERLMGLK